MRRGLPGWHGHPIRTGMEPGRSATMFPADVLDPGPVRAVLGALAVDCGMGTGCSVRPNVMLRLGSNSALRRRRQEPMHQTAAARAGGRVGSVVHRHAQDLMHQNMAVGRVPACTGRPASARRTPCTWTWRCRLVPGQCWGCNCLRRTPCIRTQRCRLVSGQERRRKCGCRTPCTRAPRSKPSAVGEPWWVGTHGTPCTRRWPSRLVPGRHRRSIGARSTPCTRP